MVGEGKGFNLSGNYTIQNKIDGAVTQVSVTALNRSISWSNCI
jgi:hypothetical protein